MFSLIVKSPIVHIVLSLALTNRWPWRQTDVNNAFLNGDLVEEVNLVRPFGF